MQMRIILVLLSGCSVPFTASLHAQLQTGGQAQFGQSVDNGSPTLSGVGGTGGESASDSIDPDAMSQTAIERQTAYRWQPQDSLFECGQGMDSRW